MLGETELTEIDGQVSARVTRNGCEITRAEGTVGGDTITSLDFLPIILYKEIPGIDGARCDSAYFVTSTSLLTKLAFKAGTATLAFTDPGGDPIARLRPLKVTSALYGTMDDLYPETIRVLKDLREAL